MGSMTVPLPLTYGDMLANDWEVIGAFMYRPGAFQTLAALVRSGLLDLSLVRVAALCSTNCQRPCSKPQDAWLMQLK